jgi:glycosyltransferase involved in cell wall biosynthesis
MSSKRALVLLTDAFGGHGGMAKFNRDFLTACAAYPEYTETVVFPRLISAPTGEMPARMHWVTSCANSKIRYAASVVSRLLQDRDFGIVVCGHINLLPVAWLASRFLRAPLVLIIHGIEAWQPSGRRFVDRLVNKVNFVIAVSNVTKQRFLGWSHLSDAMAFVLPNSIDMKRFHPKEKNSSLLRKHGLERKRVLMTLGRVTGRERYKGFDEVLEVLPELIQEFPDLVYLIVGGGDDLERLRKKAAALGLEERVTFTGVIAEDDKVDYYNLADAFLMPGRGEGFGITLLEAMACGLPTLASILDGSREALLDGELGVLVDPRNSEDLKRGIREILSRPKKVPPGLEYFSFTRYQERVYYMLNRIACNPHA